MLLIVLYHFLEVNAKDSDGNLTRNGVGNGVGNELGEKGVISKTSAGTGRRVEKKGVVEKGGR